MYKIDFFDLKSKVLPNTTKYAGLNNLLAILSKIVSGKFAYGYAESDQYILFYNVEDYNLIRLMYNL